MTDNKNPKIFYGYIIVLSIFFIMAIIWGTVATFGVFLGSLIVEFDWTRAMVSGASSLREVLFGIFVISTARLSDRFGPRIVITVCGLLLGLGYLLMSQIDAAWQLYLFYGVITAIGASAYISLLSIIVRWFEQRRGMMTGIVFSGMGLGIMIMPPVASWLIDIYEWRTSYIIMGIIALVVFVLSSQFLRPAPDGASLLQSSREYSRGKGTIFVRGELSLREAIHTKQFWLLCALYFIFLLCLLTIMVHIVIHATGLGVPAAGAANILAIIGGLSIAGMNIVGSTADRIGNRLALTISFVLMAASLFWLLVAGEVWMLYLFAIAFGFAYGGMQVLFSPIVADLFGLSSHGVILATAAFGGTIGAAIGPIMGGYIFDTTGSYSLAFLISGTLAAIGIMLASGLRPVVPFVIGRKKNQPSGRI